MSVTRQLRVALVSAGIASGVLALVSAPLALGDSAQAARRHARPAPLGVRLRHSPALWATVDICDTPSHPRTLGIRASMPGTGDRRDELFMRFYAQYRDQSGKWKDLAPADSGPRDVGSGLYRARQSGWLFPFLPAANGARYLLRGRVVFQWRRRKHVFLSAQRITVAGHPSAQSDPAHYSAATCLI